MLVRFTVENFLSFNTSQEYSPIAGNVRKHPTHVKSGNGLRLLNSSVIFGANASGKTNLVRAIGFARQTIVHELPVINYQIPIYQMYCRSHLENRDKKSNFEFEIKIGKKVYSYGFELILSKSIIVGEWLYLLKPDGNDILLYHRNPDFKKFEIGNFFNKDNAKESLKRYANDLKSNKSTLFLTEMNRNKSDLYASNPSLSPIKEVFDWFKNNLIVNYPSEIMTPTYLSNESKVDEINKIITSMGLGINKLKIEKSSLSELSSKIPNPIFKEIFTNLQKMMQVGITNKKKEKGIILRADNILYLIDIDMSKTDDNISVRKLCFYQGEKQILFEIYEESDGTRRILDLIEIIIAAQSNEEKTFIIDEINRYLHPQLTYKFIEIFF